MNHFLYPKPLGGGAIALHALQMQDYGGPPLGFPQGLGNIPYRIEGPYSTPDAVAHNDCLGAIWKTVGPFWPTASANENALRTNLAVAANDTDAPCRRRSQRGNAYDPDLWTE